MGTMENREQELFSPLGSPAASWRGERGGACCWGSVREDPRSPLLLGSAEAISDWVEEVISWLASKGVRFFEDLVVSGGWGLCRDGRPAGRDWVWGSGGSSSSGRHLCLPGKLGWTRVGEGRD